MPQGVSVLLAVALLLTTPLFVTDAAQADATIVGAGLRVHDLREEETPADAPELVPGGARIFAVDITNDGPLPTDTRYYFTLAVGARRLAASDLRIALGPGETSTIRVAWESSGLVGGYTYRLGDGQTLHVGPPAGVDVLPMSDAHSTGVMFRLSTGWGCTYLLTGQCGPRLACFDHLHFCPLPSYASQRVRAQRDLYGPDPDATTCAGTIVLGMGEGCTTAALP